MDANEVETFFEHLNRFVDAKIADATQASDDSWCGSGLYGIEVEFKEFLLSVGAK